MKVFMTGTRGIPDILGGVETHCEQLAPRLAAKGIDLTVVRRTQYTSKTPGLKLFRGVKLKDITSPQRKSLEAIIHTFKAVLAAKKANADIIHIHAIGPQLLAPVARMLGLKVVCTNHGHDYDRAKWGKVAKMILKLGERFGTTYGHEVISISQAISDVLARKYGRTDINLIFNGVEKPQLASDDSYIRSLGLEKQKYVLAVGRFVPEKNFHTLIESFTRLNPNGYKLAIAGDADIEDEYSRRLKEMAKSNGVVMPGFVKGEALRQLLSHCELFVLPSSHEGLPISLLEAMSYQRNVLVSDIIPNRIKELDAADFFKTGDTDSLISGLRRKLTSGIHTRRYDLSAYDWDKIAAQTAEVYKKAIR